MKSRIQISLGENNGPIIKLHVTDSQRTDPRDELCGQFTQNLNHISNWCKIWQVGETEIETGMSKEYRIKPLGMDDLYTLRKEVDEAIESMIKLYPDRKK